MKTALFSILGLSTLACVASSTPALAAANLITNGDFSQETILGLNSTTSAQLSGYQGYGLGATVTGWSNSAYAFVFTPGSGTSGTTADTSGASINQFGGAGLSPTVYLWGPGSGGGGVANGLTTSPSGGSFLAIDGAASPGYLTQTVSGLTVGYQYQLSFYYASAEQQGFTGATTAGFTVGWSDGTRATSVATPTLNTPSQGFTPWRQYTTTFTATGASETLSFLATGAPSGSPPMSLLDNVVLSAVPEPASLGVMAAALLATIGLTIPRRRPRPDAS